MMRRAAMIVVPLAVAGLLGTVVLGSLVSAPDANATPMSCNAAIGPWTDGDASKGQRDAARLGEESRSIVTQIIAIGKGRGESPRAWQVAIQAGMTESGLRNLDHGDLDSVGIFQMRTSMGWGTPEQLGNVEYQINKFYDVLLAVPGWETMRPGEAAQAVERSAFPDRYHEWEEMAAYLVSELGEIIDPSGCGTGSGGGPVPAPTEAAAAAIEFAMAQQGEPYVWGGQGPDVWDCSGLMLRAYQAAGITIPRVANAQYGAGAHVPVADAQPGDLIFWASDTSQPISIGHVALYIGDGQVVQAPQSGDVVKVSKIWDTGLMPLATRPGV